MPEDSLKVHAQGNKVILEYYGFCCVHGTSMPNEVKNVKPNLLPHTDVFGIPRTGHVSVRVLLPYPRY